MRFETTAASTTELPREPPTARQAKYRRAAAVCQNCNTDIHALEGLNCGRHAGVTHPRKCLPQLLL